MDKRGKSLLLLGGVILLITVAFILFLVGAPGLSVTLNAPSNATTLNYTLNVIFNCSASDDAGLQNISLYINGTTTSQVATSVVWIANYSSWRYNDSNVSPGDGWFNQSFNDSTWPIGNASLATTSETAAGGFNKSLRNGSVAYPTYYFRQNFSITNASSVINMSFKVDYDDDYIVYINGQAINSSALYANWTDHANVTGTVAHNSIIDTSGATAPVFPKTELNSTHLSYLVTGMNYLAAAAKQGLLTSSDAAFLLRLEGYENQTGNAESFTMNRTNNVSGTSNSTIFYVNLTDNSTYKWNCLSSNSSGTVLFAAANFTVTINTSSIGDTTPPVITINLPSGNASVSSVNFNVTLNEAGSACNYTLNSGTTNYTMNNNGNTDFNATNNSIADGTYTIAYYCKDTAGNLNASATRPFLVDTVKPGISFGTGTQGDGANVSVNWTYVKIDIIEGSFKNATFFLYNSTSLVSNFTTAQHASFELSRYARVINNSDLSLAIDTSDAAYDLASETIYVIHNTIGTEHIDEINLSGGFIRQMNLTNFEDTEGIVYLNSTANTHRFAIIEERRANMSIIWINSTSNVTGLSATNANQASRYDLQLGNFGNTGLEGITYDRGRDLFYIVKEKSPEQVYQVNISASPVNVTVMFNATQVFNGSQGTNLSDLAGVYYDNNTDTLFILSQETAHIANLYLNGTIINNLSVNHMTNPEGMTFDGSGDYLYVTGEADFLSTWITRNFTASYNFTNLANGNYTYNVTVYDTSGNANTTSARRINISFTASDTAPPVVTINLPSGNASVSSVNFNVTLNENGNCRYTLDGGSNNVTMQNNGNRDFNHTNASIVDGTYTAGFYCNDTSNNLNSSATRVFIVDTSAPVITVNAPANNSNVTTSFALLNWSVQDRLNDNEIWVWASNDSANLYDSLVYHRRGLSNGTYTYNWSAPVISPNITGLVSLYHFDNLSERNENASLFNDSSQWDSIDDLAYCDSVCPTFVEQGFFAGAMEMNGSKRVYARTSNELSTSPEYTAMGRFNMSSAGTTATCGTDCVQVYPLVSKGTGEAEGDGTKDAYLFVGITTNNKLAAGYEYLSGAASPGINTTGSTAISNNTWYHFAVVRNSTALVVYLNGIQDGINTSANTPPNLSSVQRLGIGVTYTSTNTTSGVFNGQVDEIAIFNRSMTSSEIVLYYNLSLGRKYWRVNASDSLKNNATSGFYEFNLTIAGDTTPPIITINKPLVNSSSSSVDFNVTLNEAGSACNYTLNSGTTNYSMSNNGNVDFNATNNSIADGSYTVAYYCKDTAGNLNASATRPFLIDTIKPGINFGVGTQNDSANVSVNWIYANISVTESNFKNITFLLKNDTATVNSTAFTTVTLTINWTGLANANYTYNVSLYDNAGNFNSTETRKINLSSVADTTRPNATLNSPANNANLTYTNVTFNCTSADNSNLKNITLYYNSTGGGATSINLIQNTTAIVAAAAATITCTLGTAATSGNLIVTIVASDKIAGTYTVPPGFTMINSTSATSVSGAMAYKISTGGETSIQWNQSTTSAAGGISCWAAEYSGTATSNVLDVGAENETSSTGDTAVTSLSTGLTGTTSQANELAIAFIAIDTANNCDASRAWSNGFSEFGFINNTAAGGVGISVSNKTLSATGTQNSTYSCSGDTGDQIYSAIATFKPSSLGNLAWHANETKTITGLTNDTTFAKNLTDNATFVWNCLACDAGDNCNFSSSNYTFNVNTSFVDKLPQVTMNAPANSTTLAYTNVTFNCSATDSGLNAGLLNISLWITNSSNTGFSLNLTRNVAGTSNETTFQLNLTDNSTYTWNCLVYDAKPQGAFNSANFTLILNTSSAASSACTEANVTYFLNPYVMAWNETTEIIRFEATQPVNATVQYGLTQSYGSLITNASFGTKNELVIMNLTPNTLYYYKVTTINATGSTCIQNSTFNNSFTTSNDSRTSFTFIVLGDSRDNSCGTLGSNFPSLIGNISAKNPDFVIMVGDDIQAEGCTSPANADDISWEGFHNITIINRNTRPILSAIGNHEDPDRAAARAAWRNYWVHPLDGNGRVDEWNETSFTWRYGNSLFIFWNSEETVDTGNLSGAQFTWFNGTALRQTGYTHKFVFGHKGIAGTLRSDTISGMNQVWSKYLTTEMFNNGVTATFHGHDHFYCYNTTQIDQPNGPLINVITGGAGSPLNAVANCLSTVSFSQFNYVLVNITDNMMNGSVYNLTGSIIHSFQRVMDAVAPVVTINQPQNQSYAALPITFNVSLNENGSSCNYTLDSGVINKTLQNNNNRNFNATNGSTAEGGYTVTYYCWDTNNNLNATAAQGFTVDTIKPGISFGAGTQGDGANVTASSVYVNVSVTESSFKNITFLLRNNSATVNSTTYATLTLTINWTNLASGNYTYNVSLYDNAGNFNSTETRKINLSAIDNSPAVTLNAPGSPYTNTTVFTKNITFNCSATDSGASAGLSNVSLWITNNTNGSLSVNQTTAISGTSNSTTWTVALGFGNYTWNCRAVDASNQAVVGANRSIALNFARQVIVIGVDGFHNKRYTPLLQDGKLANFSALVNGGGWNGTMKITGHTTTSTAPGNAEIHTGLNSTLTGVTDNTCGIAVPNSNTTFERLENLDSTIVTGSIFGKQTCYIPDGVLGNAKADIDWWQNRSTYGNNDAPNQSGTNCAWPQNASTKATEFIGNYSDVSFYLVVYLGNPDCTGHLSTDIDVRYNQSIIIADQAIGILLDALTANGLRGARNVTQILLTGDHGWNDGTAGHSTNDGNTTTLVLITNNISMTANTTSDSVREQCEIAPTVLEYFGMNSSQYQDITNNGCDSMIGSAVDTIPPVITINLPAATNLSTSSVNFNVTLNEAGSACNYTLNSGTTNYSMSNNGNVDFNATNNSIADGTYTVAYYCKDTAGNLNSSATRDFGIDSVFPSNITFVSPTPANASNQTATNITFNVTVVETNIRTARLQIRAGGVDTSNYTMSCFTIGGSNYACNYTNSSIANGRYNYTIYINDTAGNLNLSGMQTVLVDNINPGIVYGNQVENPGANVSRTWIYVNVTVTEANFRNITFNLRNDSATINSTAYTAQIFFVNFTGLSDGNYTYNATVFDQAGNFNTTTNRLITLAADTTPPVITINLPAATNISATSVNFNVTLDEAGSACNYTLNAGTTNYTMNNNGNVDFNATNTTIADGTYTVAYYCKDTAGNLNRSATRTFGIDATFLSNITFVSPTPANTSNQTALNITFNITVVEANIRTALLQIRTGGVDTSNYTMNCFTIGGSNYACNYTNSSIANGRYNYTAYINDTAGNLNNSGQQTVLVDSIFPAIAYGNQVENPGANVSRTWIYVNVTVTEANFRNITFNLRNDSATINSTTHTSTTFFVNFTGLSDGNYTYNATVFDQAGNFNTTSNRMITGDTIAPTITTNSPAAANISVSSVTFNVTTNENTQYCNYTLNSGTTNYTMNNNGMRDFNATNVSIADGNYTVKFYCWDFAGNLNNSASRFFVLDTVDPALALVSPRNITYHNFTALNLNYTVSDSLSGVGSVWYSLLNSSSANLTANITITANITFNVSQGGFILRLYANDTAGNLNSSVSVSFNVNNSVTSILYEKFRGRGNTTNLDNLNETQLQNVPNLTIETPGKGKIKFNVPVNLTKNKNGNNETDLDSNVNISDNRTEVNSTALDGLNVSANITLENITFTDPQPVKDGGACLPPDCNEIEYNTTTNSFTFNVTGFSVYSTRETPLTSPPAQSSTGGGGGGGGGGGKPPATSKIYTLTEDQLLQGSSLSLKKNDQISFSFNQKQYTLKMDTILKDEVTFSLNTQRSSLKNGTKIAFDLNGDSRNDFEVGIRGIFNSSAQMTFLLLPSEEKSAGEEEKNETPSGEEKKVGAGKEKISEPKKQKSRKFFLIAVIVIAVLWMMIIYEAIMTRKEKKELNKASKGVYHGTKIKTKLKGR